MRPAWSSSTLLALITSVLMAALCRRAAAVSTRSPPPLATAGFSLLPTSANKVFRCPEKFGYFADSSDCTKYFVCVFGEPLHEACTGGLFFSAELQTCDWPRNVLCINKGQQMPSANQQAGSVFDIVDDGEPQQPSDGTAGRAHHPHRQDHRGSSSDSAGADLDLDDLRREKLKQEERLKSNTSSNLTMHINRSLSVVNGSHGTTLMPASPDNTGGQHHHQLQQAGRDLHSAQRNSYISSEPPLPLPIPTAKQIQFSGNSNNLAATTLADKALISESTTTAADDGDGYIPAIRPYQQQQQQQKRPRPFGLGDPLSPHHNKIVIDTEVLPPSYEAEAIPPVVDSKGGIHFSDGPGGTYGLSQQLPGLAGNSHESNEARYQVFVKPYGGYDDKGHRDLEVTYADELRYEPPAPPPSRPGISMTSTTVSSTGTSTQSPMKAIHQYIPVIEPERIATSTIGPSDFEFESVRNQHNSQRISSPAAVAGRQSSTTVSPIVRRPSAYDLPLPIPFEQPAAPFRAMPAQPQQSNQRSFKKYSPQPYLKKPPGPVVDHNQPPPSSRPNNTVQHLPSQQSSADKEDRFRSPAPQLASSPWTFTESLRPTTPVATSPLDYHQEYVPATRAPPRHATESFATELPRSSQTLSDFIEDLSRTQQSPPPPSVVKDQRMGLIEYSIDNMIKNEADSTTHPSTMQTSGRTSVRRTTMHTTPSLTTATERPVRRGRIKKKRIKVQQALADQSLSPPPWSYRPTVGELAQKCDARKCVGPDCFCGHTKIPGSLPRKEIPQIVLLTFDDAVNDLNYKIYKEIFETGRKNPNGCPILATFYVSHEWTDYSQVQTLYSKGHEMASHGITHSFGEKFSKQQWLKEIAGQREILHLYGAVKMEDVRGMRAPFLQIGGNQMFEMLYDANFTYDSSMPVFDNNPPFWPYTLDYQITHECMIAPCPSKSFPGIFEVGMIMWEDLRGGRCSMADACSNPDTDDGVYQMLMKNFNRHYNSNRSPFGLFYHSAWFAKEHHKKGFLRFLDEILSKPDVYLTTNWQMIQWMRDPTPLNRINSFEPWDCRRPDPERPPPCTHPTVCNVSGKDGQRFLKTCQPCPASYPWLGNNGFQKKAVSPAT